MPGHRHLGNDFWKSGTGYQLYRAMSNKYLFDKLIRYFQIRLIDIRDNRRTAF